MSGDALGTSARGSSCVSPSEALSLTSLSEASEPAWFRTILTLTFRVLVTEIFQQKKYRGRSLFAGDRQADRGPKSSKTRS